MSKIAGYEVTRSEMLNAIQKVEGEKLDDVLKAVASRIGMTFGDLHSEMVECVKTGLLDIDGPGGAITLTDKGRAQL